MPDDGGLRLAPFGESAKVAQLPKESILTPNDALEAIADGATADELEHQQLDFKTQGRSRP